MLSAFYFFAKIYVNSCFSPFCLIFFRICDIIHIKWRGIGIFSERIFVMKRKNGKRLVFFVLAIAILVASAFSTVIYAGNLSEKDSLITLSYINEVVIPEIKESIKSELSALVDSLVSKSVAKQQGIGYEIVELKKGQKLMAKSSLEFIVRPGGTAVCISPHGDVGISDLTFSKEILNGKDIAQNSYCVIPRADGRGLLCTSSVAYIMVRGGYAVE